MYALAQFLFDLHYIVVWSLLVNVLAGDPLHLGLGTLESTWSVAGVFTPGVVWGLAVSVGPMVVGTVLLKAFGKTKRSTRWCVSRVTHLLVHSLPTSTFAVYRKPVFTTLIGQLDFFRASMIRSEYFLIYFKIIKTNQIQNTIQNLDAFCL